MINLELILNSDDDSLLKQFITQEISTEKFIITKGPKNKWRLLDKTKNFGNIYSEDNKEFVTVFAKKLLEKNFDSILISGLGLGVIPYACQGTTSIIDIVEIDEEIINFIKPIGHIHSSTNIIHGDIYNFTPQRKYDIILFNHWLIYAAEDEIEILTQKFQPYLNDNGLLYSPIKEQFKNYN
jgi:hypothetical protein